MQYYACSTLTSLAFFPSPRTLLVVAEAPAVNQPQPAAPPCRPPFPHARTARRYRHTLLPLEWQWNWISPGRLKHVGLCEPVSGVRVHHLSQSAGCVMYPWKMRLLWLCRWSGASLVKMYSLGFFLFFFFLFVVRLKEREGKRKERLVWLDLCVSAREWNLMKVG